MRIPAILAERHRMLSLVLSFLAIMVSTVPVAHAQEYPTRTVTIIVPLVAGTGMDTIARSIADKLTKGWSKPVVVENRPGAAMIVAMNGVLAAPPDGHTLTVATPGPMSINPVVFKKLSYDPRKDFIPIALYVKSPFVLLAAPSIPVKSAAELIQYVKERPDKLNMSIVNVSSTPHLISEMFTSKLGLKVTTVFYRNTEQSLLDVASGTAAMAFGEVGASQPLIESGRLRPLAVSSNTRLPTLPDVPTLAEVMTIPDFEAVSWHMLLAHAATPSAVVNRLHDDVKQATSDPTAQKLISTVGLIPVNTPSVDQLQSYLASEGEKWGAIVRKLGLEGSQSQ
jgi:tripartite-type tricarboxylate transporter receptor subunit TctC